MSSSIRSSTVHDNIASARSHTFDAKTLSSMQTKQSGRQHQPTNRPAKYQTFKHTKSQLQNHFMSIGRLSEANAYFKDIKAQYRGGDEGDKHFVFKNTRVNNSPYVLVTGKNHRELIREGLP